MFSYDEKIQLNKKNLIRELRDEDFDEKIIRAFNNVKREDFMMEDYRTMAYSNQAFPLVEGSTISQPYTIAYMLELLDLFNNQKILEIGSGSGYVLALINEISKNSEIYGIEKIRDLVDYSRKRLSEDINVIFGDGKDGYPEKSPFDRIIVSASFKEMPDKLISQLDENGILVCPINNSIFKFKKINNQIHEEEHKGFSFVPIK